MCELYFFEYDIWGSIKLGIALSEALAFTHFVSKNY